MLIYFISNFILIWYDCHIIFVIIVFGIKKLKKSWKKTFITIYQLSCFVGHPVFYFFYKCVEGVTAIIKNVKNRNFPNTWVSGKFPKYLGLGNFQNLKNIPPSNTYRYLGNFPNAWVSEKCLGIWEIPRYLGNFQNLKNIPLSNT